METRENLWVRGFIIIIAANFIFCFGFYALEPTLPLYVASLGASDAQLGLVATGFFISAVITRIFIGFLADKLGRQVMLRTGATLSVAFMLLYLVTSTSLNAALVRVLQGIGYGLVTTMFGSIAADILPDSRRGEGIGYLSMSTTGAVAFSPAVALTIVDKRGFHFMFFCAAGAMLLAAICTYLIRVPSITAQASPDSSQGAPASVKTSVWQKFYDPRVTVPGLLLFLYGICRSSEQTFVPMLAEQQGLTLLSVFFVIKTWVCFGSKFLTGKLYDRKGPAASIIPGGLAMAVGLGLLSVTRSNTMLLVVGVFSGLALGQIVPAFQAFIMDLVGRNRSLGNGLFYNFLDLGAAAGGFIMGVLSNQFGYFKMFRVGMALMLVYLVIYLLYLARRGKKAPSETVDRMDSDNRKEC